MNGGVDHLDPELIARAEYFLSYAADRRPAVLVLAERFNLERNIAAAILRKIGRKQGDANAQP